jgi:hypothetical protein
MNRCLLKTITLMFVLCATMGCYDNDKLLDAAHNRAIRTRLEEVRLGQFRTTLPRTELDPTPIEIEAELFGTTVRHKVPKLEETLKSNDYRLRHAVIIALRQTTAAEIADPNLVAFRERLLQVVNGTLGETPVESVGLRTVRFIPL